MPMSQTATFREAFYTPPETLQPAAGYGRGGGNVQPRRSNVRESLNGLQPALGVAYSPGLDLPTLAQAGYHFVFLDWDDALGLGEMRENINWVSSASGGKCVAIVRVPSAESCWIQSALDSGVGGIVVPGIKSTWDAEQVITAARRNARNPAIFVQLDSAASANIAHSLLALPGIDGAFAALDALFLDLKGLPKVMIETEFNACERAFLAAGETNGKPVMWYARNAEHVTKRLRQGYRLIVTGSADGQLASSGESLLDAADAVKRWRDEQSQHWNTLQTNAGGADEAGHVGATASSPGSMRRPKEKVHKYHIHRHIHRGPHGERSESVEISQSPTIERPCTCAECLAKANGERRANSIDAPRPGQERSKVETVELFENKIVDSRGETLSYGPVVEDSESPNTDPLQHDQGVNTEELDQDYSPRNVHFAAVEETHSPSGGRFVEEVEYDRTANGHVLAAEEQMRRTNGQETQEVLEGGADAQSNKIIVEGQSARPIQQPTHGEGEATPQRLGPRVPSFGRPVQIQPVHHQLTPLPAPERDEWIGSELGQSRKRQSQPSHRDTDGVHERHSAPRETQQRIVVAEEQVVDSTGDCIVRIAKIEEVAPAPQERISEAPAHDQGSADKHESRSKHRHTGEPREADAEGELAAIRQREKARLAEDRKEGGVRGLEDQMRDRWAAHQAKDDVKYQPRDYGGFHKVEHDLENERDLPTTHQKKSASGGLIDPVAQCGEQSTAVHPHDAHVVDNKGVHNHSSPKASKPQRRGSSGKSGSKLFGLFSRNTDKDNKSAKQKRRSRDSVDNDMADCERREHEHEDVSERNDVRGTDTAHMRGHEEGEPIGNERSRKYENFVPVRPTDVGANGATPAGQTQTVFATEHAGTEDAYPTKVVPEKPRRYENSIPLRAEPLASSRGAMADTSGTLEENGSWDKVARTDALDEKAPRRSTSSGQYVEPVQRAPVRPPTPKATVYAKRTDNPRNSITEHIAEEDEQRRDQFLQPKHEHHRESQRESTQRAPVKTEVIIAARDSRGDSFVEQLVEEEVRRGPTSLPKKESSRGSKIKSQSAPEPESIHMPGEWPAAKSTTKDTVVAESNAGGRQWTHKELLELVESPDAIPAPTSSRTGAQKITVRKVSSSGPWSRRTPGDDERVGWPHQNEDNGNEQPCFEVTARPMDPSGRGATDVNKDTRIVTAPDARSAAAASVSQDLTEHRQSRDIGRPVEIEEIMRLPGLNLTASPRHRIEHASGDVVERHDRIEAREGRGGGLPFASFLGKNKGKDSRRRSGSGSSSMASPRSNDRRPSAEALRPKPLEPGDTIDDVQTFIIDEDTVHIPGQPPKTIIRKYIVEEEVGRPAKAFAVATDSEFVAANRAATERARSASYLPARAPPYPTIANPGPSGHLTQAQIQSQFSATPARLRPTRPDLVQQCSTEHVQKSKKFFSATHNYPGGVY